MAREHDHCAASLTADLDVRPHPGDLPQFGFMAGMFFFHFNNVIKIICFFQHHFLLQCRILLSELIRIQTDRHRTVIEKLHFHISSEYSLFHMNAMTAQRFIEIQIQSLRMVRFSGFVK